MDVTKAGPTADETWTIESPSEWKKATASIDAAAAGERGLVLRDAGQGRWTSAWHRWQASVRSARIVIEANIDLFKNKRIHTVVKGSETPYTDETQTPHDWYGRCMIAVIDEHRWIMALRSGLNHISWGQRDAIHLITSGDEGRTWGALNRWFDGSPIAGMPYEDGHTHSEPGLYSTPDGDLILQFWRTGSSSGTKQLRSTDNGKTWTPDIDRIRVQGVAGARGDCAIGTEDYFIDPESPSDFYMAFQYFHHNGKAGTFLARSSDNCRSYCFVNWICLLAEEKIPDGGATFEPAIEYVGDRTIVAVLRDAAGNNHTWQSVSTDMGASFSPPVDISGRINGGVPNGQWQRARLYKESNPYFQYGNRLDYSKGEGRLWGFGLHSNGGGYTRKPVVYWSDDNGRSWNGPELLHGPMHPGTDTGYGDLKRRADNTFVAATYYANTDSTVADVEQYTFGGDRAGIRVEWDDGGDGKPDADSGWRELYNGSNMVDLPSPSGRRWRLKLALSASDPARRPGIRRIHIEAWH